MSNNEFLVIVGLGGLALAVTGFLRHLHWLAKTKREERSVQALVAVWLSLMALHCYGLYFAYTQLLAVSNTNADHSIGAIVWWFLVNISWLGNLFVYYDHGQPDPAYQPQLVQVARNVSLTAIIVTGAMLLSWLLVITVPGIPLTLPSDITLAVGSLGIFAFGVFFLDAPRRAKLAQQSRDGAS